MIEADDSPSKADLSLIEFVRAYIDDLIHACGFRTEYRSDLERRYLLIEAVRSLNLVYERIAELSGQQDKLPQEAQALNDFLLLSLLDCAWIINTIEAEHPEMRLIFETEREYYAKSLQGQDALKAWIDE